MTRFENYIEPIKLSGDSQALLYKAYRLDGTHPKPDLRRDAAVGSCNCCDYFFFSMGGNLILIEDTRLIAYIRDRRQEYSYLNADDITTFISKLVCQENVLKVYGSLFVLYRFINQGTDLESMPKIDSIQFWFVVNDADRSDTYVLDKYDEWLNQELSSKLGRTIVDKVVVMTREDFIKRCETASGDDASLGVISVQK